jgi:hypothetical protein
MQKNGASKSSGAAANVARRLTDGKRDGSCMEGDVVLHGNGLRRFDANVQWEVTVAPYPYHLFGPTYSPR